MPELPEVEVLVRHLRPLLENRTVRAVRVNRAKVVAPASTHQFAQVLRGARFCGLTRRGKYLVFRFRKPGTQEPLTLVGHLGMTGRMYLLPANAQLPKHAAVVLDLGRENFVFEDTRYFGRLTLEASALGRLGPEPLGAEFTVEGFAEALGRSRQPIKVKLLDQSLVAGVGNIYASEALFRAGISPRRPANRLTIREAEKLRAAIRFVLAGAIRCGSTIPLNFAPGKTDGLFYFGRAAGGSDYYQERLLVYDRVGKACPQCGSGIRR
ncbi:MAG: bifunctional DNA-formamidopyrimidine glycosylase/DNA-(apurinic or apyrimidinic site) lyase, partial [Verrucomicrobiota bacterium]